MPILRGKVIAVLLAYGMCMLLGIKGLIDTIEQLRNIVFHVEPFMLSALIRGITKMVVSFIFVCILFGIMYFNDKMEEKENQNFHQ